MNVWKQLADVLSNFGEETICPVIVELTFRDDEAWDVLSHIVNDPEMRLTTTLSAVADAHEDYVKSVGAYLA